MYRSRAACDRASPGSGRPLHDRHYFAVQPPGDVFRSVMLDVLALAELAGPFPARKLTGRVRVIGRRSIERYLDEAAFQGRICSTERVTQRLERPHQGCHAAVLGWPIPDGPELARLPPMIG